MTDAGPGPSEEPPIFRARAYAAAGGVTVVAFEGELDIVSVPDADEALSGAQGDGGTVVLDLRGLSFLDSSGLRVLLEAQRRAAEAATQATLQVVPGEGEVLRVFELSGVGGLLTFVDDVPPEPAS